MKDTVLVVGQDANAGIIMMTLQRARNLQVRVTEASEACDIMCCEGTALVVLDLTYPDTKGFEVLRRLRGRFETRILPTQPRLIVVTDWAESAVERLAVGLGADVVLRKPIVPRAFLMALDRLAAPATAPSALPASA